MRRLACGGTARDSGSTDLEQKTDPTFGEGRGLADGQPAAIWREEKCYRVGVGVGAIGWATPIIASRVTRAVSCCSFISSLPGGRRGITR